MNLQTLLALAIVVLTVIIFTVRWLSNRNNRNKKGCGGGCDCAGKPTSVNRQGKL